MALDFPNSPTTGSTYTSGPGGPAWQWDGVKWESIGVPGATGAAGPVSRNFLHNPYMNIQQRGAGPFTASNAFTADRWQLQYGLDTDSVSLVQLTDAQRAQIGDEAAGWGLQNTFTGTAGNSWSTLLQKIEGVRRLSGKTVTVSFWAVASLNGLQFGISAAQVFGSGGSPSANVAVAPQTVTLSTTFARYSVQLTFPSATGKTLGTNGDDRTALQLAYSAGSVNTATFGVGQQSGTITLWGLQLEIGNQATPLEKIDPQVDLANCQRFFVNFGQVLISGYNTSGSYMYASYTWPVTMRAVPTGTLSGTTFSNTSQCAVNQIFATNLQLYTLISSTGPGYTLSNLTASADL